ncbi:hypothetical protein ACO22_02566 [Paracoccidioides brasiliensis]|uniref:Uncharacterized protein n=1 Tax=Paracoccidioides brasiliensis TaxID=121759 RepID=A0A1D2JID1_PARBR|nr:hypothetical protein ACO22_02566 [Paracoccidioides brasiliensis]ODH50505.1 hypothetical protein GX48_03323 [Paracoccidioides brasiliensis]
MAGWGDTWLSPSVIERRFSIPVIFDDHAHVSSLRDDLPTVLSRFGGTTPKTSRKDFVIENIQSIIFGNAMNERNKYCTVYRICRRRTCAVPGITQYASSSSCEIIWAGRTVTVLEVSDGPHRHPCAGNRVRRLEVLVTLYNYDTAVLLSIWSL